MSGWEHRAIPEIQIGNGTLLATFDSIGEVEQLFSPNIDALQSRLASFCTTILVPTDEGCGQRIPQFIDINHESFEVRLSLLSGMQILRSDYRHRHSSLNVTRILGIHPTDPILIDSWRISGAKVGLLHRSIPWMGHATSAHCSLYHPTFNGIVHHRGRRWLGVMVRGAIQWVRVGHVPGFDRIRIWDGHKLCAPVGPGDLKGFPDGRTRETWDQVSQGTATWGALATSPSDFIEFFYICAESERHLGSLLNQVAHIETTRYFQMIEGMTTRRHASARVFLDRIAHPHVQMLAERSIDVLHALQDAHTGALIAAAELDPQSQLSGGYGFSWPRDGAYLASALGAVGYHERVEHYLKFVADTQDVSGTWWQRYLATGHAGPSWGRIQIDEPASLIRAAHVHFRRTEDLFWLEKYWPTLERGLAFLESFHSSDHPLGLPSHDLWEERFGVHAYSLAAVSSAFHAGAVLAGEMGKPKLHDHYREWSSAMASIVNEKFVSLHGPLRRSFIVEGWESPEQGYWDETPDASLLGLIVPFGIFRPTDPVAGRILNMVRHQLWAVPAGGVIRYPRDHYRGGNPWILTTLWLALVELQLGNVEEAKRNFDWVLSKATPHGMLAEQVHRETGKPCWVIPLGWSHAMFLLFIREVLDRDVADRIWKAQPELEYI